MSSTLLRLGTRGSALAMTQARHMAALLDGLGVASEIVVIKTQGDKDQVRPFAEVGAPGLFVRELEGALQDGRVDVAVHCYKDLPSDSPDDLVVVAMPEREDPRDRLLISAKRFDPAAGLLPVAHGARVGTASARRVALLKHLRPDLEAVHLRGNVPTRVGKLKTGDYDAVLLASAGLERLARAAGLGECDPLDMEGVRAVDLDPTAFVPAPSQGALALQARRDDAATAAVLERLDQSGDHASVRVERDLLARVEAGCQVPFGAYCIAGASGFELHAVLEHAGEMRRSLRSGDDGAALAAAALTDLLPERG